MRFSVHTMGNARQRTCEADKQAQEQRNKPTRQRLTLWLAVQPPNKKPAIGRRASQHQRGGPSSPDSPSALFALVLFGPPTSERRSRKAVRSAERPTTMDMEPAVARRRQLYLREIERQLKGEYEADIATPLPRPLCELLESSKGYAPSAGT